LSTTTVSIAVGPNDRTLPLMAGLVPVEGVDVDYVTAPLETIFATGFDEARYDVSELSFSNYLYLKSKGACPYVGLPIFPSRSFRHSAIYIRDDRGIAGPRDLAGRLVGVREFTMTAALVARGMLEDEFGLRSQDMRWCYGRADATDDVPIARVLPRDVEIEKIGDDETLSDLLAEGRIDAMIAYKPPKAYVAGVPHVRRLFEDYPPLERDYYRRSGHFPIMHLIGVRRETLAREPGLAVRLCDAFQQALDYSQARLLETQASYTMLPWNAAEAARLKADFGPLWRYGLKDNLEAIRTLCRYSLAQGIAARAVEPEELFAPETIDWMAQAA
jgi:4,5-dihydroxyphthalate decarboxylase